MPSRRRIFSGIGAGLEAIGEGLMRRHLEEREDEQRRQSMLMQMLPTRLSAAMNVQSGQLSPQQFGSIEQSMGQILGQAGGPTLPEFDLSPYLPSPKQATAGVRGEILGAQTPEDVPSPEEILARVAELPTGPQLTRPQDFGEMADVPSESGNLPSRKFGPTQAPVITELEQLAEGRKANRLAAEETQAERGFARELGQRGRTARLDESLAAEFAPGRRMRHIEDLVAEASDPRLIELHRDQTRSDAEIQARIQAQYRLPVPPQIEYVVTGPEGLEITDSNGRYMFTTPANTEGMVMVDNKGNFVSWRQGRRSGIESQARPLDPFMEGAIRNQLNLPPGAPITPEVIQQFMSGGQPGVERPPQTLEEMQRELDMLMQQLRNNP